MMLEIDESTGRHLNGAENRDDFEHFVIEARREENVILLAATPEIRSAHETWNVEDDDALKGWQRNSLSVTF